MEKPSKSAGIKVLMSEILRNEEDGEGNRTGEVEIVADTTAIMEEAVVGEEVVEPVGKEVVESAGEEVIESVTKEVVESVGEEVVEPSGEKVLESVKEGVVEALEKVVIESVDGAVVESGDEGDGEIVDGSVESVEDEVFESEGEELVESLGERVVKSADEEVTKSVTSEKVSQNDEATTIEKTVKNEEPETDDKKNKLAEKAGELEVLEDKLKEVVGEEQEQGESSSKIKENSSETEKTPEFPPELSKWMQNLPDKLKDIPITKLCIPGSHDTGAFQLHSDMPLAHDQKFSPVFRVLGKFRSVRNIIKRWSETQSLSIADQLKLGVRYLDLRVELAMTRTYDINPFLVHGLYGVTGPPFMKEIKKFLDENTEEIVVVDVNHVYQMTEDDFLTFFVRPMERIFGRDSFCPVMVDLTDSTLNELIETNHRLIVVGPYNHDIDRIVYSRYAVVSRWPNVNTIYNLIGSMRTEIKNEYRNLHVLQGVMTARPTDIGRHLFNSLKNVFSMDSLRATIDFVNNVPDEDRKNLNIVISDQISEEFTRAVIDQNAHIQYP